MEPKTAAGLVAYCQARLNDTCYWYGTYGQKPTPELLNQKVGQYPYPKFPSYTPERVARFRTQMSRYAHACDCVGMIKGYLWSDGAAGYPVYNAAQDVSADGMRVKSNAKPIASAPDLPGTLVFMSGHVGVYIGNGQVIEARGSDYGVVKTMLRGRPWLYWGQCPWLAQETGCRNQSSGVCAPAACSMTPDAFRVGDRVRVRQCAVRYRGSTVTIPDWVKKQNYTINGLADREGMPCGRLAEIQSWVAVKDLEKALEVEPCPKS